MRNARARPQQCWKSCPNGSNIVALRFGDHGTKEMLGVVGWKVWPVSNFVQQHLTTCNRVCKRTQHITSNNVGSCLPTMLRPFARGLKFLEWGLFCLFGLGQIAVHWSDQKSCPGSPCQHRLQKRKKSLPQMFITRSIFMLYRSH